MMVVKILSEFLDILLFLNSTRDTNATVICSIVMYEADLYKLVTVNITPIANGKGINKSV